MQDSRCAVRDFPVKHTKEEILKHKTETVDVFIKISVLIGFEKIQTCVKSSSNLNRGHLKKNLKKIVLSQEGEKKTDFLMTLRLKQLWLYFWFKLLNLLSKVFPSIQGQLSLFGITLWILSLLLLKLCWVQQKTLVCFKHVWEKLFHTVHDKWHVKTFCYALLILAVHRRLLWWMQICVSYWNYIFSWNWAFSFESSLWYFWRSPRPTSHWFGLL